MSIASALTALQADVTAARTAITAKGGTITPNGGTSQLATDIATIQAGGDGGLQWLLDLMDGEEVTLDAQKIADINRLAQNPRALRGLFNETKLYGNFECNATTVDLLTYTFYGNSLSEISFPNLLSVDSMENLVGSMPSLKRVLMPSLTSAGFKGVFQSCPNLEYLDLSSLTSRFSNQWQLTLSLSREASFVTIKLNPNALGNNIDYYLGIGRKVAFTVICTEEATMDIRVGDMIDTDGLLDILRHLSPVSTGTTFTIPNGKTIPSSDPNYADIASKVAELTNWTITGLIL